MIAPLYYTVNGEIIFNEILARHRSYTTGKPVEFICYDQEYDLLDWSQEPQETMDQLLTEHALNLRNKYQRLIFLWSGGTDSHTIYNIFVQNNIHIDEIMVMYDELEFEKFYPQSYVEWMIKNHPDPLTKITPRLRYDLSGKALTVDSEDWIFQNRGIMPKIGVSAVDNIFEQYCKDNYSNERWAIITGIDPPSVIKNNGRWYSRINARGVCSVIGFENIENFFLEPRIHLKQSHMAKKFLKQMESLGNPIDHSNITTTSAGYTLMARAIGRHRELNPGTSFLQKVENSRFYNTKIELDSFSKLTKPSSEPGLLAALDQHHPVAQNYIHGLYNLLLERNFWQHLQEQKPVGATHTFPCGVPFFSKLRDLGP